MPRNCAKGVVASAQTPQQNPQNCSRVDDRVYNLSNHITAEHCDTLEMKADLFTKPLARAGWIAALEMINVC